MVLAGGCLSMRHRRTNGHVQRVFFSTMEQISPSALVVTLVN